MNRIVLDLFVASCIIIVLVTMFAFQGRKLEGLYMPVAVDFMILNKHKTKTGWFISGVMNKVRDCDYVSMSWYREDEPAARRVSLQSYDQPKGVSKSRALGIQHFGIWELGLSKFAKGPDVYYGVVRHRCHFLWDTTTKLGPIDFSK